MLVFIALCPSVVLASSYPFNQPVQWQVGIGTSSVANAGLTVMSGNVGIGTWVPGAILDVVTEGRFSNPNSTTDSGLTIADSHGIGDSDEFLLTPRGNDGSGFPTNSFNLLLNSSADGFIIRDSGTERFRFQRNGNVGIGSFSPGQMIDVQGTVRAIGFTMTSQTPMSGYVLTATDTGGDMTWTSPSNISAGGWTVTGNNLYATNNSGNVGIGTTIVNQAALTVMNGNVGIGTWAPAHALSIARGVLDVGTGATVYDSYNGSVEANYFTVFGNTGTTWSLSGKSWNGYLYNDPGANTAVFGVDDVSSDTSALLIGGYSGSSSTNVFYVNHNGGGYFAGNVGIGTWAPSALLDVTGTLQHFYVVSNGNVGIGNPSPGSPLDVIGTDNNDGIRLFSLQRGSVNPPNLSFYRSLSSGPSASARFKIQGSPNDNDTDGFVFSSPNSSINWIAADENNGGEVGSGLVSNATDVLVFYQQSYFTNGTLVVGNDNSAATNAAGGIIRSGQKNQAVTNVNGSSLTLQAGNGTGSASGSSNLIFQTPDATVSGTSTQTYSTKLEIFQSGNVGIGSTVTSANGKLIVYGGNVGIGSLAPGQTLDVTGTVRAVGLTMSGQTPMSGYVLTASDSAGDTTWTAPSAVGGAWTVTGNNMYETNTSGNVGIGTTIVNQAALTVMNGNVGIGTWVPNSSLYIYTSTNNTYSQTGVGGQQFVISNLGTSAGGAYAEILFKSTGGSSLAQAAISAIQDTNNRGDTDLTFKTTSNGNNPSEAMRIGYTGNVAVGTTNPLGKFIVWGGNVGIGSNIPSQALDVTGTIRAIGLTMTGQTPMSGYILTASDTAGDATWTSPSNISAGGWTVTGNNLYATNTSGNVGIGTTIVNQAALTVMDGNVGIGTWAPSSTLVVNGSIAGSNVVISANTTLNSTHYIVNVNTSTTAVTVTLPSAVGIGGRCYLIKDETGNSAANNITINTSLAQTIDGVSSVNINNAYASDTICSNGTNWGLY